jgi:site-specific recombinase
MNDNELLECARVFLRDQEKLFDEPVADTIDEAKDFLEDCFAQCFDDISQVREYLSDEGMDVDSLSDEELEDELEVFKLDDGRYFVVEG